MPIEIHTTLVVADWRAYVAALTQQLQPKQPPIWQRLLIGLAFALVSALVIVASRRYSGAMAWPSVLIGAVTAFVVMWLLIWLHGRRARQLAIPEEDGCVLGPCTMRFDAHGVHTLRRLSRTSYEWPSIRHVSATSEHLFLWVDRLAALIIPVRDLPAGLSTAELQVQFQHMREAAGSTISVCSDAAFSGAPAPSAVPQAAVQSASLRDFISAVGRLLVARPNPSTAFDLSDRVLAGLILFHLTAWLVIDWLRNGSEASFEVYGIVHLAWHAMVIVLIAWLFSRAAEPRISFRRTFAIALVLVPLYMAGWWAAEQWPKLTWLIGIVGAMHISHCFQSGVQSVTGRLQVRAQLLGFCVMLGAIWAGVHSYATPRFWYAMESYEDDPGSTAQQVDAESLLYRQTAMIDTEVARMQRPPELAAAGFFVGFAGVGEQKVFASEIALAQQMIARHFNTTTRSLQLVNDQRDLQAHPLASLSGLERTLTALAGKMDLQRDVLFLSLSSHGSRDAELSVSNGMLALNDLPAKDLAKVLRESGIRRKVIIVSACFAGTFIEPLRDPDTIIITAAAADRSSFGCADDRDLTYFGEAFYRDALQQTGDLQRAFELAKTQIARREEQEGKLASNPQAYFGPQLTEYLRTWSREPLTE